MKKTLAVILSSILLLALATAVLAGPENMDCETPWKTIEDLAPDALADMFGDSYPYSVDYDWPECKSDPVIKGTVIVGVAADGTTHCWSNGTDNASCAFDGDTTTFYDPYEASTKSWCGLLLDQPYELTEVRICNRSGQESRIIGAAIQGSNDNGVTWHNVVYFDKEIYGSTALLTNDYHIVTPEPNQEYIDIYKDVMDEKDADFSHYWVGHGSYNMYRYVNLVGTHGDCADIELYGHPADAYIGDEKVIEEAKKSTGEEYFGTIDYVGTANVAADGGVTGKVIGGGGSYSAGANEYADAWDGDGATFYDPASAGQDCWTGILADQATVLTEVRVMPRVGWNDRTAGAAIQGSNNGVNWTTLAFYDKADCLAADAEQAYIVKPVEGAAAYWMFRYISLGYEAGTAADGTEYAAGTSHGDVGDILLIGTPGEATLEYEVPAAPAAEALKCNGKEYDEAAAAAKDLGTKMLTKYEFVEGADVHFDNEGPENLWDDDVTTKFCTNGFPAWSVAQVDGKYAINGIIMATANDNSSNPGRAPGLWTIYGSNDNAGWDVIATGDDTFFTEVSGDVDYTFFAASIEPTPAYSYFKFECTETPISLMQVSAVVLCSADAPEAEAPVEETPTVEEVVTEAAENVTEAVGEAVENAGEAAQEVAENVTEAVGNAAEAAQNTVNNAVDTAKKGCGSFIGGGMIVIAAILGSAWISRRK